jgi:hypothetical protein
MQMAVDGSADLSVIAILFEDVPQEHQLGLHKELWLYVSEWIVLLVYSMGEDGTNARIKSALCSPICFIHNSAYT